MLNCQSVLTDHTHTRVIFKATVGIVGGDEDLSFLSPAPSFQPVNSLQHTHNMLTAESEGLQLWKWPQLISCQSHTTSTESKYCSRANVSHNSHFLQYLCMVIHSRYLEDCGCVCRLGLVMLSKPKTKKQQTFIAGFLIGYIFYPSWK